MTTDNTQFGSDIDVTRKDTPTEVGADKIKDTQELDEILERLRLWCATDNPKALRSLNDLEAKQALLDWHNKQMLAELGDSLHNDNLDEAAYSDIEHRYDKYFDKLKESN